MPRIRTRTLAFAALCVVPRAEADVVAPRAPDMVRTYAPILWLADDERTYPMLPHPFAFDGVDNDADGCIDVADADEVRLAWWTLAQAAKQGSPVPPCDPVPAAEGCRERPAGFRPACWTTAPRPKARVLYAPPELFAGREEGAPATAASGGQRLRHRDVERAPSADGGEVVRVGPRDLRRRLGPRRVYLHQYWFYYPYDDGPNGHPDDGEHVSIFVEEVELGRQHVKGVVGVGHMPHNVNNILVKGTATSEALFPLDLRPHMPILVELGKHASAPDRNCNGRFDLGLDANLYPEAVWGSRDVWAGNVGQALKVGTFQDWFSYSRSRRNVYAESGWNDAEFQHAYTTTCDGLDDAMASMLRGDGPKPRTYDLFAVTRLVELYERIAADGGDGVILTEFLRAHADEFWGGAPALPPIQVSAAAAAAMKEWARETSDRREVWLHEGYRVPNNDFREWLFARAGVGISTKADAGNWVTGFSLRFSEVKLPKRLLFIPLPGGIGGSQALHDSRVEAYAHFDGLGNDTTACPSAGLCFYDAGVDVFSGRGRFGGSYVGMTWKRDYNARRWYQHVGLGAGVEFGLPSLSLARWTRPISVMGTAGLSAQLFRPRRGDVEETAPLDAREISGVRAQLGLRVTYGFWPPRHPLSY